ncbi:MAG: hypothetical protein LC799_13245 [Actinobacteria bacterium]|nr:hypothetical protein [Actinomycetota bacterium]
MLKMPRRMDGMTTDKTMDRALIAAAARGDLDPSHRCPTCHLPYWSDRECRGLTKPHLPVRTVETRPPTS